MSRRGATTRTPVDGDGPFGLPALELEAVSKRFPGASVPSLHAVDLAVGRGEAVAIVGESGSGKTTLLRLCNRLVEPSAGSIRLAGVAIREIDAVELRRGIGYVQQEGGLIPHWTVRRNVGLVPRLLGWEAAAIGRRVDELLALVELDPGRFAARYPAELSGGQRQRVAFARALAAEPSLVLLDEPFGALDPITRLELRRQLKELAERLAVTMLLVTHDLDEALYLGNRVAVLKEGRLLQVASPDTLVAEPADDYVRKLLATRPGAARS